MPLDIKEEIKKSTISALTKAAIGGVLTLLAAGALFLWAGSLEQIWLSIPKWLLLITTIIFLLLIVGLSLLLLRARGKLNASRSRDGDFELDEKDKGILLHLFDCDHGQSIDDLNLVLRFERRQDLCSHLNRLRKYEYLSTRFNDVTNEYDIYSPSDKGRELALKLFEADAGKSLPASKIEYEEQIETLEGKIANLESSHVHILKEADESKAKLNRYYWLVEIAQAQSEEIRKYVCLEKIEYYSHDFGGHYLPSISFRLTITNRSVYDVIIEETLGGKILFKANELHLTKSFQRFNPLIRNSSRAELCIEQRLGEEEIEFIKKGIRDRKDETDRRPPEFQFGKLQITVKGSDEFPQIKSQQIEIGINVVVDVEDVSI